MRFALAALFFIAACAPPKEPPVECAIEFSNQGTVRVLSIGHHVELDDARDLDTFEASFRRHLPMIRACSAGDRPTLVVFPEDSGLVAWFVGQAGLYARGAGDTETAFNLLYATMWRQADAYRAKFPGISSARALTLALSDHAWRAMERTFSRIAREANVWVVTSANLPPVRESNDVADKVFLDGEAEVPAYIATSSDLFNVGLVYSPDGTRVHETRKVFLTDTEEQTLDLSHGSLEAIRTADLPFGKLGIAISRDAFYPPFNQRLDDLGAELVVQPEAFSGWTQEEEPGDWLPEVIIASSWSTTRKHAATRFSAMPVLTGNVLSVIFDGQPWVTSQSTKTGSLVGMEAVPGFESIGAWTFDDDLRARSKRDEAR